MTQYINSIQQVSITITAGTSNTATITSVGSNAFLIYGGFTCVGTSTDAATAMPTIVLTNATTITATLNTAGTCTVNCYVLDPTSNLVTSVQAGTITCTGTTSNTATITSVDTTKSVVFHLGATTNNSVVGTFNDRNTSRFAVTNATTVTLTRGGSAGNLTGSYVVVTFAAGALNSSVQQFATVETALPTTQTITSVNTSNTMIAWGGLANDEGVPVFNGMAWLTLTNATTVTITSTTNTNWTCGFAVVEFVSGVLAQAAQYGSIALTSATSNTATITSAATATSICAYYGDTGTGTTDATSNMAVTQTNATTVTGTLNTAATGTVGYGVFTFTAPVTGGLFPFLYSDDNTSGNMQALTGGMRG